jgi:hypothetical protein
VKNGRQKAAKRKFGHIPISMVSLLKISPSPENEQLCKPVSADEFSQVHKTPRTGKEGEK